MKLTLMTLNMVAQYGIKYLLEDQDAEDFKETWLEMLDLVRDAGFTAVDVSSYELMGMGADIIREELSRRGLSVSCVLDIDTYIDVSPEGYERRMALHRAYMDDAVSLGAKVYMLTISAFGEFIPEGLSSAEMHGRLLKYFRPLAERGRELGLHVVIEDTPDLRFFLDRTEDVQAILDQVPGLELVFDSGNMILVEEDPVAYYRHFSHRIGHIHLKDMTEAAAGDLQADTALDGRRMTCAPVGTGCIDMQALIPVIRESGYDGYLTVEYAKHEDRDWLDSLRFSREYYENLLRRYKSRAAKAQEYVAEHKEN